MIIQSIISGGVLPDAVAAKALAYIRSDVLSSDDSSTQIKLPDGFAYQWLKVWLLRKNRINNQDKEVPILYEYDMNCLCTAYHYGGLMAIYAAIQQAAMPNVKAVSWNDTTHLRCRLLR